MDDLQLERLSAKDRGALVTVAEAAATLHLSVPSVWRRVRDGRLEAVRLGGPGAAVRIRAESVRNHMSEYEVAK